MAKQALVTLETGQVHLVGTVQGFVPDADVVRGLLDAIAPQAIGLGVPPEDMEALKVLAEAERPHELIGQSPPELHKRVRPAAGAPGIEAISGQVGVPATGADDDAAFASLDPAQERFLELLARFGPVRLPSPDLEVAFSWAQQHDVRIEALDLDDEAHAEVYIRANRFRDVWRSGRIQKKLQSAAFDAPDSDALAIDWDAFQNKLPSLQKVETAREAEMAQRARALAAERGRVLAIVPVARWAGVRQRLESEPDDP